MKIFNSNIQFLFGLVIFLGFNSCSQKQLKQEKIKIGVVAPLTGEGATYGASMKRGFDLAFDGDSTLEILYQDSKFDSKLAVTILEKYISVDKIKIIYGEAASGVSLAMVPVSDKNKVIQFSSISSSDDLQKSSDYFFRNVPRNSIQGKTAAEWVFSSLKSLNAAILKDNDDYGLNLAKSFSEIFKSLGGQIVADETYNSGDKNFKTQLGKIKTSGSKVVFMPGNYAESSLILKQAKELGLSVIFIGGDGSYSPELIETAGKAAEGFYCTIMGVDTTKSYYSDFKLKFISKYNKLPDVYDAYAYEGGMILKEAISKSGNDVEKVKHYLYKTTFNSLTGELMFDSDGEVLRNYSLVKVIGGSFVPVNIK
ncbi:MAG: ABC transporter substrate-binding protein [Bacteroidetes bacterium]|nr:ABC transporter substrate-binding protein [Bacteroidota bacterium]